MIELKINNPGDTVEFDKVVRKFKKLVSDSGILEETKDRRYYKKPSEIKRLQRKFSKFSKRR